MPPRQHTVEPLFKLADPANPPLWMPPLDKPFQVSSSWQTPTSTGLFRTPIGYPDVCWHHELRFVFDSCGPDERGLVSLAGHTRRVTNSTQICNQSSGDGAAGGPSMPSEERVPKKEFIESVTSLASGLQQPPKISMLRSQSLPTTRQVARRLAERRNEPTCSSKR